MENGAVSLLSSGLAVRKENCIIIDWLTFSSKTLTCQQAKILLGLENRDWRIMHGSSLHYEFRAVFEHISIHYTQCVYDDDGKEVFNPGCCVEMSGQGCREFETFGRGDWAGLMTVIYLMSRPQEPGLCTGDNLRFGFMCNDFHVKRVDLAFDDFSGVVPIREVFMQAVFSQFTSRLTRLEYAGSCDNRDESHHGLSVIHGSRSSNCLIRIYDKRVERKRYDLDHWVRVELQFRDVCAMGFVEKCYCGQYSGLGEIFAGCLRHYLQYRDPGKHQNKRRWKLSKWYVDLVGSAESISVWSKKDVEYNRAGMERYAYKQNHNHTKSMIMMDGIVTYLRKLFQNYQEDLPDKYKHVIDQSEKAEQIQKADYKIDDFNTFLNECAADILYELEGLSDSDE